eukprot:434730-Amphidinium_carterae.1
MEDSISSGWGECQAHIADNFHVNGLLDAGQEARLAGKGNKGVTDHVVAANHQCPRAGLSVTPKGVKDMAARSLVSTLAVLAWRVSTRGRQA